MKKAMNLKTKTMKTTTGRPKKNEINHRFSLIITTKKLRDNIFKENEETGKDMITIINQRLTKSYEKDK